MTGTSFDDPLVDVLTDARLRRVVSELGAAGKRLSVTELANRLGADEGAADDDVTAVELELYHDCVPRLSDLGFVSFDADSMTVALSCDFGQFEEAHAALDETLEAMGD